MSKPKLFLLHFAGGNIYSYNFFRACLSDLFEFIPIELPGRGKRISEPFITKRTIAIDDLVNQISKHLNDDSKFMIYGHSLGAFLGFHLIKRLQNVNFNAICFVNSGNPGPDYIPDKVRYNLSDELFILEMIELGGISPEILSSPELLDFITPIIKSDFELIETDCKDDLSPINCPIYSFIGREDKYFDKIENWKNFTTNRFESKIMEGNHFSIFNHIEEITSVLKKAYNESLLYQY